MSITTVANKFKEMGARVKIWDVSDVKTALPFVIDVQKDKQGEFFDIKVKREVELLVQDVQKKDRHLLLVTRNTAERNLSNRPERARFLCGHDERNWFTCGIPTGATSVFQAKQDLKPTALRMIEEKEGLKTKVSQKRHRRLKSGKKIHRQGEFMFIPDNHLAIPETSLIPIHHNEPMRRTSGRGNAHYAQYLYRTGGEAVWTSNFNTKSAAQGLTDGEYRLLVRKNPKARAAQWKQERRNPEVWVKGKITHKEHATLDLGNVWHKVYLNTEILTGVAFID